MKKQANVIIILMLGVMISSVYANPCNLQMITNKIEQRLDNIDYYQVKIKSTLNNQQSAEMMMYGKRPDLLKATMKISDTDRLTVVFDKHYQWIEEGNTVYQINLNRLIRLTNNPFDTPYSLAGGLLSGEDYVGTVKALLKIYDFKATCQGNVITLKGNLNVNRFAEYTKSRHIVASVEKFVKQFVETLGQATLKITKDDYLLKSYMLEGKDKSVKFTAIFSDYNFDPITTDQLSFHVLEGTKIIDITPGESAALPVPATDENVKIESEPEIK